MTKQEVLNTLLEVRLFLLEHTVGNTSEAIRAIYLMKDLGDVFENVFKIKDREIIEEVFRMVNFLKRKGLWEQYVGRNPK